MHQDYTGVLLFCLTEVSGLGWRHLREEQGGIGALPLDLLVGRTSGPASWKHSESQLLTMVVLSHVSALKQSSRRLTLGLGARCARWQVRRQVPIRTVSKSLFIGYFYFGKSLFFHLESVLSENLRSQNSCLNIVPCLMGYLLHSIPHLLLLKYMGSYFLNLMVMKYVLQKGLWHRVLPVSYEALFLSGSEWKSPASGTM